MKRMFFIIVLLVTAGVNLFALKWGNTYWLLKPSEVPEPYEGASYKYLYPRNFPSVKYEIYFDASFAKQNGEWVYYQWNYDHGWWLGRNKWEGNGLSEDPIRGAVYIDPYEKVAIYFLQNGDWQVYRVRVLKN